MRNPVAILTRGIPGCGKSTWANEFVCRYKRSDSKRSAIVLSTDDHFVDAEGVYRFNASELGKAHAMCFARFCQALRGHEVVVVANTFTQSWELESYRWYSNAVGARLYVKEFIPSTIGQAVMWAERNIHGVTKDIIGKMLLSYESDCDVYPMSDDEENILMLRGI